MAQDSPKGSSGSSTARAPATTGSHAHTSGTTKQTVFEVTGVTTPRYVHGLISLHDFAQEAIVRLEEKVNGTYRSHDPEARHVDADEDGVPFEGWVRGDYKLTLESVVAEGSTKTADWTRAED